jgi:hypothetical protein
VIDFQHGSLKKFLLFGGGKRILLEEIGVDDGLVEPLDEGLEFGRLPELLEVGVAANLAKLVKPGLHADIQGFQARLDLRKSGLIILVRSSWSLGPVYIGRQRLRHEYDGVRI